MSYVVKRIRLVVPANKAKPSPQIGQALGAVGINMMKFCKEFNAKSTQFVDDMPMRVRLSIMNDGSYTFTTHTPQSSFLIKKCTGIASGSGKTSHEVIGKIHAKQVYEIAKVKQNDNPETMLVPMPALFRSVIGTCRNMGLEVDFSREDEIKRRISEEQAKKKRELEALEKKNSKKKGAKK